MDLASQLEQALGLDRERSAAVLGTVFTAIRVATDTATFGKLGRAFPDLDRWMQSVPLTGRTGEILALRGPGELERQLRFLGLSEQQCQRAGAVIGSALRELLPEEPWRKIESRVPLIRPA